MYIILLALTKDIDRIQVNTLTWLEETDIETFAVIRFIFQQLFVLSKKCYVNSKRHMLTVFP